MVRAEGALSPPAVPHLGAAAASAWMPSACVDLEGLSPLQAIKAGDTRRKSEHAWRRYSTREFSLVRALRADPLALGTAYETTLHWCAPKQASVACIDVYRVTNAGDAYAYYHAWFRFRLLGSELVARAGYDMTGKMADDLPSSENRSVLLRRCHDLVRTRQPNAQRCERIIYGETTRYEAVWMPLSDDGERVNMLFGALIYLDPKLGSIPPRPHKEAAYGPQPRVRCTPKST